MQLLPWGQTNNDRTRQLTTYLRLVNPSFQFQLLMICVLQLTEGISMKSSNCFVMFQYFIVTNLPLIIQYFEELIGTIKLITNDVFKSRLTAEY